MKLTLDQVRHVATLARLALSPEEEERTATQLSAILDAVETLAAVDTSGVPPTSSGLPLGQHTRPDVLEPHLGVERALANAPQRSESSFVIPKVIE